MFAKCMSLIWITFHVFFALTTHVIIATNRYSDINLCERTDLNYNQCIASNIISLKDKLCKGSAELNILPIEPLDFDDTTVIDVINLKLYVKNSKMDGHCNFDVNSVQTSSDRLQYNLKYTLKKIYINSTYDFNVRLIVPITREGKLFVTADNVEVKTTLNLKVITRKNKTHVYASKASTNVKIANFDYKFDEGEKELIQLHEIFKSIVEDNRSLVIKNSIPTMEKKLSQVTIELFNNITQSNYEKFFPENI